MSPHTTHGEPPTEEWSLLDLLLVVSDHLKPLILIPALLGLLTWGICHVWPQTYDSTSILNTGKMSRLNEKKEEVGQPPQQLVTLGMSDDLLDRIGLEQGIASDTSRAQRVKAVRQQVALSFGKQDKLITLRTYGRTPLQAQQLNEAVWKQLLPFTQPRPSDMARIQTTLAVERQRLQAGTVLEQHTATLLQTGKGGESATRLYGELLNANAARMQEIAELESQADGLTTTDLIQMPTLSELPIAPRKMLISLGAALGSAALLLVFFVLREMIRSTPLSPQQAQKLARLRRSLGLRTAP